MSSLKKMLVDYIESHGFEVLEIHADSLDVLSFSMCDGAVFADLETIHANIADVRNWLGY